MWIAALYLFKMSCSVILMDAMVPWFILASWPSFTRLRKLFRPRGLYRIAQLESSRAFQATPRCPSRFPPSYTAVSLDRSGRARFAWAWTVIDQEWARRFQWWLPPLAQWTPALQSSWKSDKCSWFPNSSLRILISTDVRSSSQQNSDGLVFAPLLLQLGLLPLLLLLLLVVAGDEAERQQNGRTTSQ